MRKAIRLKASEFGLRDSAGAGDNVINPDNERLPLPRVAMSFERELEIYNANLMDLLANEGQFVVIRGEEIAGAFATYDAALEAGYTRYGPVPFLVRKIQRAEPVHYFSRDLPCLS
jgi:hypothetical protein